jgi:hypothetical protein
VLLHRVTDIRDPSARLHRLDRLVQRLVGDPQQRRRFLGHLADRSVIALSPK